jgi:hypothetical protein
MSKKIFVAATIFALLITLTNTTTVSAMMISQVLYNPSGNEAGSEAVELYNPSSSAINISFWAISTESSTTDATIPQGSILCSKCYYLVADSGWSISKDNSSWPNADYEEAMILSNTDAGVALKNSTGDIIDAVGWGNPQNIGQGLFEGTPHSGISEGGSMTRNIFNATYVDSNNNSNDFSETAPDFHNTNSSSLSTGNSNANILVTIVVSGSGPSITSLNIKTDDDNFLNGSQISPVPGTNKTVEVETTVTDDNGIADISNVVLTFNDNNHAMTKTNELDSTTATYSGSFNLSSSFNPGNYTITTKAIDLSGFSANSSTNFEYLTLAAVELDANSLVFFATPGTTHEIVGDVSSSTATNITLHNLGNTILDFEVWSTNFTSGSSIIESTKLQYTFNGDYSNSSVAGNMTNYNAMKDINLDPDSKIGLSLKLNVPLATVPGNYSGKVSLTAVNSG